MTQFIKNTPDSYDPEKIKAELLKKINQPWRGFGAMENGRNLCMEEVRKADEATGRDYKIPMEGYREIDLRARRIEAATENWCKNHWRVDCREQE